MSRESTVEIAYVPFKTFLTALDTLRQGVPDPVDKSVFRNQSFSTQAMLISSFKALGALDEAGHPQPILRRLIDADTRKDALHDVLQEKYREVIALGLAASEKQFDDCFAAYGVQGDTRKKAKSFFLQAAQMANIPLSPHIPGARSVTGENNGAPRTPRRRRSQRTRRDKVDDALSNEIATAKGAAKSVQLRSGGEITLSASVDVMTLSTIDRRFVFELIDKMSEYEEAAPESTVTEVTDI